MVWFGLDVYCGGCLLALYIHCLLVLLQGVGGFGCVGFVVWIWVGFEFVVGLGWLWGGFGLGFVGWVWFVCCGLGG